MRKLLRQEDDEQFGGLAFLNACQTAEPGCRLVLRAFHNVGFAGMIGTENQTVDQFANPFGLDFLESFLDRGEPVGMALRNSRSVRSVSCTGPIVRPVSTWTKVRGEPVSMSTRCARGWALGLPRSPGTGTASASPLPEEPYPSLSFYDRRHRALLAGRDDDVERFAMFLDDASTASWCCMARAGWESRRSCGPG